MTNLKHIFFDLDHTLWDFEQNSRDELTYLFSYHKLHQKGISLIDEFIKIYKKINNDCWALYRVNKITKENLRVERFHKTLNYFGIEDIKLSISMADNYVNNSPKRTLLIDGSIELLNYLQNKYNLHIITNGFHEVQLIKLNNSGLSRYFDKIITSEKAGEKKPHKKIFDYALKITNTKRQNSILIGDNLDTDIKGAIDYGMPCIYFNPSNKKHNLSLFAEVKNLKEIKRIL
jgi:putative hydrolase of the HAD superfamily